MIASCKLTALQPLAMNRFISNHTTVKENNRWVGRPFCPALQEENQWPLDQPAQAYILPQCRPFWLPKQLNCIPTLVYMLSKNQSCRFFTMLSQWELSTWNEVFFSVCPYHMCYCLCLDLTLQRMCGSVIGDLYIPQPVQYNVSSTVAEVREACSDGYPPLVDSLNNDCVREYLLLVGRAHSSREFRFVAEHDNGVLEVHSVSSAGSISVISSNTGLTPLCVRYTGKKASSRNVLILKLLSDFKICGLQEKYMYAISPDCHFRVRSF